MPSCSESKSKIQPQHFTSEFKIWFPPSQHKNQNTSWNSIFGKGFWLQNLGLCQFGMQIFTTNKYNIYNKIKFQMKLFQPTIKEQKRTRDLILDICFLISSYVKQSWEFQLSLAYSHCFIALLYTYQLINILVRYAAISKHTVILTLR